MRIYEHKTGAQVKLFYLGKEHDDIFNTEILDSIEKVNTNHIICKPIEVSGQLVRFSILGLMAEVTHQESGRVYRYRIYKCGHFLYKGETLFALFSKDDVKEYNRRRQFRVGFTAYGEIQPRASSKVYSCYVHDISFSGIGVHVRKDSKFNGTVGEYSSISFTHPRSGRVYKVSGPIVRVDDSRINDEFYIVGVSVDTDEMYWTRLVANEERINIQKQRGLI